MIKAKIDKLSCMKMSRKIRFPDLPPEGTLMEILFNRAVPCPLGRSMKDSKEASLVIDEGVMFRKNLVYVEIPLKPANA